VTQHKAPQHPEFEVRYDTEDQDRIATSALQTLPWRSEKVPTVRLTTSEFTSVCPWSGLPDFATIEVAYSPVASLVEQKSYKYYLLSFRNVGILQEEVVDRIFTDLELLLQPRRLIVRGLFTSRGGIAVEVVQRSLEERG